MTVERITSLQQFERVRPDYEAVYGNDPHRTVFVSWSWLHAFFTAMRRRWMLLAVRDGERYRGFGLLVETGLGAGRARIYRELAVGAYPTADYTSILLDGDDEAILVALAREIDALRWDRLRASNVNDPRVARLIAYLRRRNDVSEHPPNPCRFVPLPKTWGEYVVKLNGNKQYVVRRYKHWQDASLVEADDASIDQYIELLLRMHHDRWNSNLRTAKQTYGRLFRTAYERGCCRIAVLWSADRRPLAAQAAFTDTERRTWGVYMLAYDRAAGKGSPGIGMLAKALDVAIQQGFAEYDFLRGDESYKERFGADVRMLENYVVCRRSARSHAAVGVWNAALAAKAFLRRTLFGRTL